MSFQIIFKYQEEDVPEIILAKNVDADDAVDLVKELNDLDNHRPCKHIERYILRRNADADETIHGSDAG